MVGFLRRGRPQSVSSMIPTLRFRGKISLGFAVVLAISAVSMGFAYLGFERVSNGVAAYRTSVSESNLAQNIDRELVSYRSLVKYYVVTGKEDDAKAALVTEATLNDAINQSMKNTDTSNKERTQHITSLSREFHSFTKIFADVVKIKHENELVSQNQLMRSGNLLRYKLDDLPSGVEDDAALAAITLASGAAALFRGCDVAGEYLHRQFRSVHGAAGAIARLKFVEAALHVIPADEAKVAQAVKEASTQLEEYRKALTKLIDNAKELDELSIEMADSTVAIMKASNAMKADLLADQQRLDSESGATISETQRLIVMLAIGSFLLGAVLALLLGRQISRPMTAMCKGDMRELAGGKFDVVLPGLGRKDELGEMAAAVEEFKVEAVAKAERDAAALDAQNKASAAGRRTELIRFADEFEANVGSIVANVSASAVQLEASAGTLTRTAETTQDLSGQAAGASEQASYNMQSIAAATEELSASVDEIGRQAQQSNRIAEAAVLQSQQTDRAHWQTVARRTGDRRRRKADYGDCRADQSFWRSMLPSRCGPRRRIRSRLCLRRLRSEVARRPDRQGDHRDFDPHHRHARRHPGIGRRDQGNRRDHWSDIEHRLDDCERSRGAKLGHAGNCTQRAECCRRDRRGRRKYHGGQAGYGGNRLRIRQRSGCGAFAVCRKQPAARRAQPLHGQYSRRSERGLHSWSLPNCRSSVRSSASGSGPHRCAAVDFCG